jgi:hypothetical protein
MQARDRLWLDLAAMTFLVVQTNPGISGIPIHQWIGIAMVVPLATHTILNWNWVMTAVGRFMGKIRPAMRSNLIIDAGLFLSMMTAGVSGVLLVPGLAATVGVPVSLLWHAVHLAAANLAIGFFLAHLFMHARWMLDVVRRMFQPPKAPATARAPMTKGA